MGMFIELKADSAHRAGTDMVEGFFADIKKISGQGVALLITKSDYREYIAEEANWAHR